MRFRCRPIWQQSPMHRATVTATATESPERPELAVDAYPGLAALARPRINGGGVRRSGAGISGAGRGDGRTRDRYGDRGGHSRRTDGGPGRERVHLQSRGQHGCLRPAASGDGNRETAAGHRRTCLVRTAAHHICAGGRGSVFAVPARDRDVQPSGSRASRGSQLGQEIPHVRAGVCVGRPFPTRHRARSRDRAGTS